MSSYVFNSAARDTLDLSRAEAKKRHHEYIGTEHILLGLLASKDPGLDDVIGRLGIDRVSITSMLETVIKRGNAPSTAVADLPFTSRAKRVLELALESARSMDTTDVGPEHLLMGLCAEARGVGAMALADAGVELEGVRKAVLASDPPGT